MKGKINLGKFQDGVVNKEQGMNFTNVNSTLTKGENIEINRIGQVEVRKGFKKILSYKSEDWNIVKKGVRMFQDLDTNNLIIFANGLRLIFDQDGNDLTKDNINVKIENINEIIMESDTYFDKLGRYAISRALTRDKDGNLEFTFGLQSLETPYNKARALIVKGFGDALDLVSDIQYYQQRVWLSIRNQLKASKIGYQSRTFITQNGSMVVEDTINNVNEANNFLDMYRSDPKDVVVSGGGIVNSGESELGWIIGYDHKMNYPRKTDVDAYVGSVAKSLHIPAGFKMYDRLAQPVVNNTIDTDDTIIVDAYEQFKGYAIVKSKTEEKYYVRGIYTNGKAMTQMNTFYNASTGSDNETVPIDSPYIVTLKSLQPIQQLPNMFSSPSNLRFATDAFPLQADDVPDLPSTAEYINRNVGNVFDRDLSATLRVRLAPILKDKTSTFYNCFGYIPCTYNLANHYEKINTYIGDNKTIYRFFELSDKDGGTVVYNEAEKGASTTLKHIFPQLQIFKRDSNNILNKIETPAGAPIFRNFYKETGVPLDADVLADLVDSTTEDVLYSTKIDVVNMTKYPSLKNPVTSDSDEIFNEMFGLFSNNPIKAYKTMFAVDVFQRVGVTFKTDDSRGFATNVILRNTLDEPQYSTMMRAEGILPSLSGSTTNEFRVVSIYFNNVVPYSLDPVDYRTPYQRTGMTRATNKVKALPRANLPFLNDLKIYSINDPAVKDIADQEPRSIDFTMPKDASNLKPSDPLDFKIDDNINFIVKYSHLMLFCDNSIRFFRNKNDNAIIYTNDSIIKLASVRTSKVIKPVVLHAELFFLNRANDRLYKTTPRPTDEAFEITEVGVRINGDYMGTVTEMTANDDEGSIYLKNDQGKIIKGMLLADKTMAFTEISLHSTITSANELDGYLEVGSTPDTVPTDADVLDQVIPDEFKNANITGSIPYVKIVKSYSSNVFQGSADLYSSNKYFVKEYEWVKADINNPRAVAIAVIALVLGGKYPDQYIFTGIGDASGYNSTDPYGAIEGEPKYKPWLDAIGASQVPLVAQLNEFKSDAGWTVAIPSSRGSLLNECGLEIDQQYGTDKLLQGFMLNLFEGSLQSISLELLSKIDLIRNYCKDINVATRHIDRSNVSEYNRIYNNKTEVINLLQKYYLLPDDSIGGDFIDVMETTCGDVFELYDRLKAVLIEDRYLKNPILSKYMMKTLYASRIIPSKPTDYELFLEDIYKGEQMKIKELGLVSDKNYMLVDSRGSIRAIDKSMEEEYIPKEFLIQAYLSNNIIPPAGKIGALDPNDPIAVHFKAVLEPELRNKSYVARNLALDSLKLEGIASSENKVENLDNVPVESIKVSLYTVSKLIKSVRDISNFSGDPRNQFIPDFTDIIGLVQDAGLVTSSSIDVYVEFIRNLYEQGNLSECIDALNSLYVKIATLSRGKLITYDNIPDDTTYTVDRIFSKGRHLFLALYNKSTETVTLLKQKLDVDSDLHTDEIFRTSSIYVKVKTNMLDGRDQGLDLDCTPYRIVESTVLANANKDFYLSHSDIDKDFVSITGETEQGLSTFHADSRGNDYILFSGGSQLMDYNTKFSIEKSTDGNFKIKTIKLTVESNETTERT